MSDADYEVVIFLSVKLCICRCGNYYKRGVEDKTTCQIIVNAVSEEDLWLKSLLLMMLDVHTISRFAE